MKVNGRKEGNQDVCVNSVFFWRDSELPELLKEFNGLKSSLWSSGHPEPLSLSTPPRSNLAYFCPTRGISSKLRSISTLLVSF